MIREQITFTDYNGNEVTKEYHFNLSAAELAEMHLTYGGDGDFKSFLEKIVESNDGKAIIDNFKKILRMSIGIKSEDGLRFSKSEDIADSFMQSPAYDKLFLSLVTNAGYASKFINGIFPKEVIQEAERIAASRAVADEKTRTVEFKETGLLLTEDDVAIKVSDVRVTELEDNRPAWIKETRKPTKAEVRTMSHAQLVEAMGIVTSE